MLNKLTAFVKRHKNKNMLKVNNNIVYKMWIISDRNHAKRLTYECIKCFKSKSQQTQALMGELPRLSVSMLFYSSCHRRELR